MSVTIAVDLDSTVYDFESPFRDAMFILARETGDPAYLKGAYHIWDEWRSPADVCGMDMFEKALALVHSDECISSRRPFDGCVDTLRALHHNGYKLRYISNRSYDAFSATKNWLDNWGFPIDKNESLICTMASKSTWLADCQYLIDDRPRTLVDFVYSDPRRDKLAFSLMYPYNRGLTDIPNIYLAPTWSGLNHYLVSQHLLNYIAYDPLGV